MASVCDLSILLFLFFSCLGPCVGRGREVTPNLANFGGRENEWTFPFPRMGQEPRERRRNEWCVLSRACCLALVSQWKEECGKQEERQRNIQQVVLCLFKILSERKRILFASAFFFSGGCWCLLYSVLSGTCHHWSGKLVNAATLFKCSRRFVRRVAIESFVRDFTPFMRPTWNGGQVRGSFQRADDVIPQLHS